MNEGYKDYDHEVHKSRFDFLDMPIEEVLSDKELSYDEQIEQFDYKAIIHEFSVYGNGGDMKKMAIIFDGLLRLLKNKKTVFIEEFFNLDLHKVIFNYGIKSEDESLRLMAIEALQLFIIKDPNCLPYFIECDILEFITSVLHLPHRKEATESLFLLCLIFRQDSVYLSELFNIFPIKQMKKMLAKHLPAGFDKLKCLSNKPRFLQFLGNLLSIVIESGSVEENIVEIATLVYNANFEIENVIPIDGVHYVNVEDSLKIAFQGYKILAEANLTIPDCDPKNSIYPQNFQEYFNIISSFDKPEDEAMVIYGCIGALPFLEYKILDLYDFRPIQDIVTSHKHDAAGKYALNCLLRFLNQDETGELIQNFIYCHGFEFLLELMNDCNFSTFEKANEIFTYIVNFPEVAAEDLLNNTCREILANSITLSDEGIIRSVLKTVLIIGIRAKNQNMLENFYEFIRDVDLENYVGENMDHDNEEISELANRLNDFLRVNCE